MGRWKPPVDLRSLCSRLCSRLRGICGESGRSISAYDDPDEDVNRAIMQMLWKNHRLFPPSSPLKAQWDFVM